MKTIGMISSYRALEKQGDWLWQQTPHPFGVWGNIQMQALANKPDFLLMYQFNFPKTPRKKSWLDRFRRQKKSEVKVEAFLRGVPKERIIYLLREPPLDEVVEKHKLAYKEAQKYCGYVSGPDDFAPTPDYMPAIWYHANSFRDLHEMPPPEKTSSCSWITSGINRTANHRQRLDFLKSLQSSGIKVDFYGRDLPSWTKSSGELGNKWYGMAPYYYNLAIENYSGNNWYVSEKLWDALLAWCLPIYYGGSAADKLLPSGSFLRLPSLDEKGIAYIQEITATPDAWYEAKDAIAEARQIILHELNLLNWLSNFVKQQG
ncbi:glycosyltransferase [Fischerella thermalis CCMEE 5205]|uniref:Glycosyltransferase n=1 Tax=Fischerella thermalis CCMEE 5318 TaxID=2019666 RepID=A0A2N6L9M3_9CYAN|nr:glycosyltransferase family 10 [Fischerella thermalis]PMB14186.1 glycosyltransferase [Fischerella thermalis CCMEE 5319]PMB19002.1 glycosyltransferase [Fischerella thermalis CCMEE 5318]PMB44247.1 glycosyltransferase [Fischerella thermalis CCMEE 5205]